MPTLRNYDGTSSFISWKEIGGRLWPFGKWVIVWNHVLDGKHDGPKTTTKLIATNAFYMNSQSIGESVMMVVGIKKVGGFFDGVSYKPTIPKAKK